MNRIYTPTATKQQTVQDNFDTGRAFEMYVINLFNEHSFYLKKWRESKKFDNTFSSLEHTYPDLELIFKGAKKYQFAVECKWRTEFLNGKIIWATDTQICSYRMFQDRVRIPVFVAIGIGGKPAGPEKLFVTPLNNICMHNEVFESNLIPFKRKPTHEFGYDIRQLRLF